MSAMTPEQQFIDQVKTLFEDHELHKFWSQTTTLAETFRRSPEAASFTEMVKAWRFNEMERIDNRDRQARETAETQARQLRAKLRQYLDAIPTLNATLQEMADITDFYHNRDDRDSNTLDLWCGLPHSTEDFQKNVTPFDQILGYLTRHMISSSNLPLPPVSLNQSWANTQKSASALLAKAVPPCAAQMLPKSLADAWIKNYSLLAENALANGFVPDPQDWMLRFGDSRRLRDLYNKTPQDTVTLREPAISMPLDDFLDGTSICTNSIEASKPIKGWLVHDKKDTILIVTGTELNQHASTPLGGVHLVAAGSSPNDIVQQIATGESINTAGDETTYDPRARFALILPPGNTTNKVHKRISLVGA